LATAQQLFPKTRTIIQKNFHFVNTLFYNFKNYFLNYIKNCLIK